MKQSSNSWSVFGYISVGVFGYLWSTFLLKEQKLNSLVYAAGFSIIEFLFTAFHKVDKDGRSVMNFPHFDFLQGHTTWPQFWCNCATLWLFIDIYMSNIQSAFLRILLFPLNIWILEILEGYFLIFLYGRNVAWTYEGSDAFFHGNIKLSYWKYWMLLSSCLEVIYPTLRLVLSEIHKVQ